MSKIFIFFICFSFIFAGCSPSDPNQKESAIFTFGNISQGLAPAESGVKVVIPYQKGDPLNPYKAKSLTNNAIMPLVYQSLIKISKDYSLEYIIAKSISRFQNQILITINSDILFSDGSQLKIEDVVYSIEKARNSIYSKNLKGIEKVEIKGEFELLITLRDADFMFPYSLDFPIVKKASPDSEYPIGSGRYSLKNDINNMKLVAKDGENIVELSDLKEYNIDISRLKFEELSALIFESYPEGVDISSLKINKIPTNKLVYLGANSSNYLLKDKEFKKAISFAIDRNLVLENAFAGMGKISSLPINPILTKDEPNQRYDLEDSKNLLDSIGYNQKNIYGYRYYNGNSDQIIELNLLINKESKSKYLAANILKSGMKEIGIKLNITEKDFEGYSKDIKSGNYDIYLGEVALSNNFELSIFFERTDISNFFYVSDVLKEDYTRWKSENISTSEFSNTFLDNLAFIPILFKDDMLFANKNSNFNLDPNINDVYRDILS